ncbi:MAG TPA: flippase-like domain-containing protein [Nitrospiraceae bacterium]|nr:flippase-like domain-containing protein [Nitrospiraceae bacterium]
MLRFVLLALGLVTLAFIVWHIGPGHIYSAVARLGPTALLAVLGPSVMMYMLEAQGWRMTLGRYGGAVPFWKLLAIRSAGEVVNMTTPSAYVGGEPLKAYLLKRHGVPMVEGLASVVTAKTTMTIAQIGFILIGVAVGFWLLGRSGSPGQTAMATMISLGLLAFGVGGFVLIQRRGIFATLLSLLRKMGLAMKFLNAHEAKLLALDRTIAAFYSQNRAGFLWSILLFFLGWLAETIEVYVMLLILGEPATFLSSIAIGALSVFIKGGAFFIPGSLGAQDAGNLLLVTTFGYGEVTGITFALLRRFRELVWVMIGLGCLAVMGRVPEKARD